MAAGVVQQTKRTTIEMRTMTSILSSGLCSDLLRVDVLELFVLVTGGLVSVIFSMSWPSCEMLILLADVITLEGAGEEGGVSAFELCAPVYPFSLCRFFAIC